MAARRSLVGSTNILAPADYSKIQTGRRVLDLHFSGSCLGICVVCYWLELDSNVKHSRIRPRLWCFTGTGSLTNTLGVSWLHCPLSSTNVFARAIQTCLNQYRYSSV